MTASMIISAVLICTGLLFMLASLIGIIRLPDFFTRLHAQGIGDTLGAFLILAGMTAAVHGGLMSVKILLIFIIIVLTNPIGTNLMMIAAINKEDYLGYRTRMTAGEEPEEGAEPEPGEPKEDEGEKIKPAEQEENKGGDIDPEPAEPAENRDEDIKSEPEKPAEYGGGDIDSGPAEPAENRDEDIKSEPEKPAENEDEDIKPEHPAKKGGKGKKKPRRRKPSMSMNKAELIKAASDRGIEVPEKATKREILDLIYSKKDV